MPGVSLQNAATSVSGPASELRLPATLSATRIAPPDFVLDRGHLFGSEPADEDKRALIEFLKTF